MERAEGSHFDGTDEVSVEAQTFRVPVQEIKETSPEPDEIAQPVDSGKAVITPEEIKPEMAYQMLRRGGDKEILAHFEPAQQKEIEHKQKILSSLAYFIGKDFKIPVELNAPGAGWHWDFEHNIIRIDPNDLLEKPMDYLRFVISHEAGHRRVSRTEFIPREEWSQPGFSIMMNAIEDPRTNNFVAENYPKFREQMQTAYEADFALEKEMKEKASEELGQQPRFMQASFEYIKQWMKEINGGFGELSEDLPDDVKEVISKTLTSAQDSWWRYPSRREANQSEEMISRYAQSSYEINRDEVWPEFKKLIDQDIEDQKMEQKMRDMQKEQSGEGDGTPELPQELKDQLTPEQQQELTEALGKAMGKAKEQQQLESRAGEDQSQEQAKAEKPEQQTAPIDLDSLSEGTKQQIREYIENLPEEVKEELRQRAEQVIRDFEEMLNEELRGKLSDDKSEGKQNSPTVSQPSGETPGSRQLSPEEQSEIDKYKDLVEKTLEADKNVYEEKRREVMDIINKLEDDLREIFVARRTHAWESGFRSGKHVDIKRRIQEKAKEVPVMESRAWKRRELPLEKDYAISLLVDLSGSMQEGGKIDETFKGVIVLSEVLNRLSIDNEILGFNSQLQVFKGFQESMSDDIREKMGQMLSEVRSGRAGNTDTGWATTLASDRLSRQQASEKFLVSLSDGLPYPSLTHSGENFELSSVIKKIDEETNQKLIGLGIGQGTGHVERYYPNSLANVNVAEMADKLSDLVREVIESTDQF